LGGSKRPAYDARVIKRLLAVAALAACSFEHGVAAPDGNTQLPRVGFVQATSLADEASGTIEIPVALSEDPAGPVTVGFRVGNGGTATEGEDFTIAEGTLTLTSTAPQSIVLSILPDAIAEPDETIELELRAIVGAVPSQRTHTVTISANILPRVTFTQATASVVEAATTKQLDIALDIPSLVPVTVSYAVAAGTASASDFSAPATTVTFAPGETAKQIPISILQDTLDEFPEDLTVTLTGADAAIVGATASDVLTITDDGDPAPTVYFTMASESQVEGNVGVALGVVLSGPSGKPITVPFSLAASSTASNPADFTFASTAALAFAAETTGPQTITVSLADDASDEDAETVTTVLGAPTNATLSSALPVSNTLTILDDDLACYGPSGAQVCFDHEPTAPVTLTGSISTNAGSAICEAAQPTGWIAQGQPEACFVKGTTITTNIVSVTGSRPLVLVASGNLTVQGLLDVSSHRASNNQTSGPGSPYSGCAFAASPADSNGNGGGGGAGGSFLSTGGNGGTGDGGNTAAGAAGAATTAPSVLRAGCDGQRGGAGTLGSAGLPGRGGGVVYLIAGGTLTMTASGIIDASGSGGAGAMPAFVGGSGGGSGGMIRLYATAMTFDAAAKLMANGGGGSSGASSSPNSSGAGFDPNAIMSVDSVAGGGTGGGGKGGDGFALGTAATAGAASSKGGGGGGGGGGLIESNLSPAPASASAGEISISP